MKEFFEDGLEIIKVVRKIEVVILVNEVGI
jgi:hypothetical protein